MSLKTTNASTIVSAVNLSQRIKKELNDIIPLIEIKTKGGLTEAETKLKFLIKLIGQFKRDEIKSLHKSDLVALDILFESVVNFVSNFEEKSNNERIETAQYLLVLAKNTFG